MAKQTDYSKLPKRRERLNVQMENLHHDYETQIAQLQQELQEAIVKANLAPLMISEDATPITTEGLRELGLKWDEKASGFRANIGRLYVFIRECGHWFAYSSATYGGTISSYRDLQSIEEVKQLLHLFGMGQTGEQSQE